MTHQLTGQNHKGITVKCGKQKVVREDATVWASEVTCSKCQERSAA